MINMALSANQLQAMYARRRAMEVLRTERVQAVDRYYDQWGKVTKRYQSWTNPEYYEQADAQLRKKKENDEKATQLTQRREKMKTLFSDEQSKYEEELNRLNRSKQQQRSRQQFDVDLLEKIAQQNKERQEIKRKVELESKLYGRWRHNVDDDNSLYDSKSNHQVLAKLNWLDKKVEEQMQREKDETESQERNLRLQEELRKMQEAQLERQQLRAKEIKDVQALQEQHMEALKESHQETQELRNEEKELRLRTRELSKEKELLEESSAYVREGPQIAQAFNLKKIKDLMRQRAQTYCNQIKLTINILERMRPYAIQKNQLDELLENYRKELESEQLVFKKIDGMFESEAKRSLQANEEEWQTKHLKRHNDMKRLIDDECYMFNARLKENTSRQSEIIQLRERHLKAIEDSNDQLGKLVKDQSAGDNPSNAKDMVVESSGPTTNNDGAGDRASAANSKDTDSVLSLNKTTSSFQNLNLDVWQSMEPVTTRKRNETPTSDSQRSLRVVTPGTAERPRFARKRVAWT